MFDIQITDSAFTKIYLSGNQLTKSDKTVNFAGRAICSIGASFYFLNSCVSNK